MVAYKIKYNIIVFKGCIINQKKPNIARQINYGKCVEDYLIITSMLNNMQSAAAIYECM